MSEDDGSPARSESLVSDDHSDVFEQSWAAEDIVLMDPAGEEIEVVFGSADEYISSINPAIEKQLQDQQTLPGKMLSVSAPSSEMFKVESIQPIGHKNLSILRETLEGEGDYSDHSSLGAETDVSDSSSSEQKDCEDKEDYPDPIPSPPPIQECHVLKSTNSFESELTQPCMRKDPANRHSATTPQHTVVLPKKQSHDAEVESANRELNRLKAAQQRGPLLVPTTPFSQFFFKAKKIPPVTTQAFKSPSIMASKRLGNRTMVVTCNVGDKELIPTDFSDHNDSSNHEVPNSDKAQLNSNSEGLLQNDDTSNHMDDSSMAAVIRLRKSECLKELIDSPLIQVQQQEIALTKDSLPDQVDPICAKEASGFAFDSQEIGEDLQAQTGNRSVLRLEYTEAQQKLKMPSERVSRVLSEEDGIVIEEATRTRKNKCMSELNNVIGDAELCLAEEAFLTRVVVMEHAKTKNMPVPAWHDDIMEDVLFWVDGTFLDESLGDAAQAAKLRASRRPDKTPVDANIVAAAVEMESPSIPQMKRLNDDNMQISLLKTILWRSEKRKAKIIKLQAHFRRILAKARCRQMRVLRKEEEARKKREIHLRYVASRQALQGQNKRRQQHRLAVEKRKITGLKDDCLYDMMFRVREISRVRQGKRALLENLTCAPHKIHASLAAKEQTNEETCSRDKKVCAQKLVCLAVVVDIVTEKTKVQENRKACEAQFMKWVKDVKTSNPAWSWLEEEERVDRVERWIQADELRDIFKNEVVDKLVSSEMFNWLDEISLDKEEFPGKRSDISENDDRSSSSK